MFRILSVDGGGVRGIYPAHFLKLLADQVEGHDLRTVFDLYVGTSTGGLIVAAIACGIPLDRVVSLYETRSSDIFGTKRFTARHTFRSAYDTAPLRRIVEEMFGDRVLGDVASRLVLPATDISNGNVFVLKSGYLPTFVRDRDVKVADAVLASAAAPLFFDPVRVKEYLLADGGVWGNNPSLIAYTEAAGKLQQDPADIRLLSVGTGIGDHYYDVGADTKRWGFATGWQDLKLVDLFFNLQSRASENSCTLLLKEKYLRIGFQESGSLPLDDVTQIPRLKAKAAEAYTYHHETVKQFPAL
jgi:patatin-like phospholipase/acyl hydrolase